MSVEAGLLDANILVYAMDSRAAQHVACRVLLEATNDPGTSLYVTSQILCEFYSSIANSKRFPNACSSAEALRIISALLVLPGLHVLPAPARVVKSR